MAGQLFFRSSLTRFVNPCLLKVRRTNILTYSNVWAPSVGGVQKVTNTLARGVAAQSDRDDSDEVEVTVATPARAQTSGNRNAPVRITGDAGLFRLILLIRRSDIELLAGPGLLPPLLAWRFRKKAVIFHRSYQAVCPDGSQVHFVDQRICYNSFGSGEVSECVRCRAAKVRWLRGLISVALAYPRLWLCRRVAANIAESEHVSAKLGLPRTTTIYNAPAERSKSRFVEFPLPEPAVEYGLESDLPSFAFIA
jgi:hypothetical protein